jgi:hypothetical protein
MMLVMRNDSGMKANGGRETHKRIIRLVFDGTSGPMRFEAARVDWSAREFRPRRDERQSATAR